jgi:glutathione synthase/RimK-type ligase-like ATP-grasp enzyme
MTLLFATCDHQPWLTEDDQVLAAALARRGVTVAPIPWTGIDPYAVLDAPPVVLRSTWDYHRVPTLFRAWLQSLEDSGRGVWNDPVTTRRNIDKIYVQQLHEAGIAVPVTRWLDRVTPEEVRVAMENAGWSRAVLKPRVAATAYGTCLVERDTSWADLDLAPARAAGALLQEFVPEIATRGEVSLVYIDGVFTHAVVKQARTGDFRVQKDFGGSVDRLDPSPAARAFADRVMATAGGGTLYARVDLVETARGPLLMELELIEPELYFLLAPEAADRMADAILARL